MKPGWLSTMPPAPPSSRRRSWSTCTPSFVHLPRITSSLFSPYPKQLHEGGTYAVKGCRRDQGSAVGASLPGVYTGELSHRAGDRDQKKDGTAPASDPWAGALVRRFRGVH